MVPSLVVLRDNGCRGQRDGSVHVGQHRGQGGVGGGLRVLVHVHQVGQVGGRGDGGHGLVGVRNCRCLNTQRHKTSLRVTSCLHTCMHFHSHIHCICMTSCIHKRVTPPHSPHALHIFPYSPLTCWYPTKSVTWVVKSPTPTHMPHVRLTDCMYSSASSLVLENWRISLSTNTSGSPSYAPGGSSCPEMYQTFSDTAMPS